MMSFLTPELLDLLLRTLQALVIMVGSVVVCAALIWVERRLLALWQDRYGPNRVGPFGSLQVVADMLKLIFKEDWTPDFVDKLIFTLAPTIAMATLLIAIAIIPMTPTWGVSDIDIGILLFLGMAGLAVYSVMFAGWASNSKYALLGGVRSTAQTISYEVFMGIAVMGVVVQAGSFNMRDIVLAQQDGWYIVPQFLGFINFALAGVAVAHRAPFDLPEAESELAAGYHTEYSGLKWGMFMVAEYLGVLLVSMLLVTLYFGGWLGPSWLWPGIWFSIKTAVFIALFILIRAALARPRYDQMMDAGWKVCLPLSLLNLLVTGAAVLIADGG